MYAIHKLQIQILIAPLIGVLVWYVGGRYRRIHPPQTLLGKASWELPSFRPDAAGWAAHKALRDADHATLVRELFSMAEPPAELEGLTFMPDQWRFRIDIDNSGRTAGWNSDASFPAPGSSST